jgi:tRNA modification GTPase
MATIYALASGRGRAGVAVIRISGPATYEVVSALCGDLPQPRVASLRKIRWHDDVLDQAIVLIFEEGRSFTGEMSAELHIHGGLAVTRAVFEALGSFADVRLAEAGEFTRRALDNGRMELFEVEGLVDLIDAETEAQRRQAQRMLEGSLSDKVAGWRGDLLHVTALVEAIIDFADEDVPIDIWPEVSERLAGLQLSLQTELSGLRAAERIRSGFEIAIFGPPNVGKSSLINALTGRDVAIVSAIAGTTRDIIETRLDVDGLPVVLFDTAGLRASDDVIEVEGIRRATARVEKADIKVVVVDQAHDAWEAGLEADIKVSTKADLGWRKDGCISVSAKTGEGLDELKGEIGRLVAAKASLAGVVVNERHRVAVSGALTALVEVRESILQDGDEAIVAMKLREARVCLETLMGRIDTEEVLGEIFGRFCIGK